jgi:hypothetical protein
MASEALILRGRIIIYTEMGLRILSFLFAALATGSAVAQTGSPLAPWMPGSLDIHQISTGRGNAALFILPDGTTMLVDAGAAGDGQPETDPHPNASRTVTHRR